MDKIKPLGFIKVNTTKKIHQCNMVNNQDYSYGQTICGIKWTSDKVLFGKENFIGLPQDYCQRCFKVAIVNGKPFGIWVDVEPSPTKCAMGRCLPCLEFCDDFYPSHYDAELCIHLHTPQPEPSMPLYYLNDIPVIESLWQIMFDDNHHVRTCVHALYEGLCRLLIDSIVRRKGETLWSLKMC